MPVPHRLLALLLTLLVTTGAYSADATPVTDTTTDTGTTPPVRNVPTTLQPFIAYYKGSANGLSVGNLGERELTSLGNGRYRLQYRAKALIYSLEETSVFDLVDGQARPLTYRSVRGTIFNRRKDSMDFDWNAMTIKTLHKNTRREYALRKGTQDPLSGSIALALLLQQAQPQLEYPEAGKRDIETDKLVLLDEPTLTTEMGEIPTWHLKRIHDDPKRQTEIWIHKQYPAIPVKVHQIDDGDEFLLNLVRIKLL